MTRALLWTVLAAAPFTQARFGRILPREHSNECCPCPAPGQPNNGIGFFTVTQSAQTVYVSEAQEFPKHTVTVEHTVTAEPHTVYVTLPNNIPSNAPLRGNEGAVIVSPKPKPSQQNGPQAVTLMNGNTQTPQQQQQQQQLDQPHQLQSPKTVTVMNGNTQPAEQLEPSPATKTIQPDTLNEAPGPKTVTVNANPPTKMISVVTVTQGQPSSEVPWFQSTVTVTQGQPPQAQQQKQPPGVVTVAASAEPPADNNALAPQPEGTKTVVVMMQPSSPTAQPATVTAPPQAQTVIHTVDHYSTLTKTVAGRGGDNIEIIIINIYTGEASCRKKHSGKPCRAGNHRSMTFAASGSSSIPSPSINATNSVATVYNTILVTLPPGNGTGSAQPTGSKGKKPRAPVSIRKW